jgi:methyl-accepting chemotaxis protein
MYVVKAEPRVNEQLTNSAISARSNSVVKMSTVAEFKSPEALLSLIPDLRQKQQDLAEVSKDTEQEFLRLGTKLQEFATRAKRVSKQASSIAELTGARQPVGHDRPTYADAPSELITDSELRSAESNDSQTAGGSSPGDQDQGAVASARRISQEALTTLRAGEVEASKILAQIKSLTARLDGMSKLRREFEMITRSLRVQGISIKIQSANVGAIGADSLFLADEVSDLSMKVDDNIGKLFDRLKSAQASITGIYDRMSQHMETHRSRLEDTEVRMDSVLGKIEDVLTDSASVLDRIASLSAEISRQVGEVVASMQFHDITRQKMEHVIEAIEDICRRMEQEAPTEPDLLPAWVAQVGSIQINQLDLVKQEMADAGRNMASSLQQIAQRSRQQAEEAVRIIRSADIESHDSVIAQFQEDMATIASCLSDSSEMNRHMLDEVGAITRMAGEMSSFLRDVEMIAGSVKLLALNAQIKAAQMGGSGRALGVLAEEVRRISGETHEITNEVSAGLKSILDIMDGVQAHFGRVLDQGIKDAEAVANRAAEAGARLRALDREVTDTITDLDRASQTLASDILNVIPDIRFPEIAAHRLASVNGVLETLVEEARALGPDAAEVGLNLDELVHRYTMQSERQAHAHSSQKLQETELLEETAAKTGDIGKPGDEDDFGDNVELF